MSLFWFLVPIGFAALWLAHQWLKARTLDTACAAYVALPENERKEYAIHLAFLAYLTTRPPLHLRTQVREDMVCYQGVLIPTYQIANVDNVMEPRS